MKQIVRVVRTGRSLGVILDAKHRPLLVAKSLDGLVVQIRVRHLDIGRQRIGVHGETVILGRDLDLPCRVIFTG